MKIFEREYEKIKNILSPRLKDGEYTLNEGNLRSICYGFFTHGKADGLEEATEKLIAAGFPQRT